MGEQEHGGISRHARGGSDAESSHHDRLRERLKHTTGPALAIGGHEEKGVDGDILSCFVGAAGGERAHVVLLPCASSEPRELVQEYRATFRRHGVTRVDVLDVRTRQDANTEEHDKLVQRASGLFITGGDQGRLVELVIGTRLMEQIQLANVSGTIVAGTSAGASVLAEHMLVGGSGIAGDSGEAAARKSIVDVGIGLGLVPAAIIDQHFSERGRMGRLLSAFAANPGLIGIGLDENTAVLTGTDGMLQTLGEGMVTIVDGREATSDYFEREAGEVLTITGSSLTVLGPGRHFDLLSHALVDKLAT